MTQQSLKTRRVWRPAPAVVRAPQAACPPRLCRPRHPAGAQRGLWSRPSSRRRPGCRRGACSAAGLACSRRCPCGTDGLRRRRGWKGRGGRQPGEAGSEGSSTSWGQARGGAAAQRAYSISPWLWSGSVSIGAVATSCCSRTADRTAMRVRARAGAASQYAGTALGAHAAKGGLIRLRGSHK